MIPSSSHLRLIFVCFLTRFCTFSFLHWSSAPCHIPIYYTWCPLCKLDTISAYLKCRKQTCCSLGYTRNQFCPALALHFFNRPWLNCVHRHGVCHASLCPSLNIWCLYPAMRHPRSSLLKASAIVGGLDFSTHQCVSDKYLALPRIIESS